jgi:uncharacterized protein YegP (UPF0339 family)
MRKRAGRYGELWRDDCGDWHWHVRGGNHRNICTAGEGVRRRAQAILMLEQAMDGFGAQCWIDLGDDRCKRASPAGLGVRRHRLRHNPRGRRDAGRRNHG